MKDKNIDISIFFLFIFVSIISIFTIYSAIFYDEKMLHYSFHIKQLIWTILGIIISIIIASFPPTFFSNIAYILYGISVFLLVILLAFNIVSHGVSRWFVLGPIKIQPSEFAKITTILAIAKYLNDKKLSVKKFKELMKHLFVVGLITSIPAALIIKQPDLGTSTVFFVIPPLMLYWAGLSIIDIIIIYSPFITSFISILGFIVYKLWIFWLIYFVIFSFILIPNFIKKTKAKWIGISLIIINTIIGILTSSLWNSLKDYQKKRIVTFINPSADPYGAGYQVIQSKIAVGSGGLFGKGWLNSTQIRLDYLPEQHTDFIFATYSEQFGFIGAIILLLLYFLIVFKIISIVKNSRDEFVNLYLIGFATYIVYHLFINIGMTIGIMPVTGLPLVLMSYGGSITLSMYIILGFILSAIIYENKVK